MLAFARTQYQDGAGNQTYTFNHSVQLGHGALNFSLSRLNGSTQQTQGFLTFTMQLDRQRSLETSADTLHATLRTAASCAPR